MNISSKVEVRAVREDDLRAIDWDGTGLRLYVLERGRDGQRTGRERVVAERTLRGAWRDPDGTALTSKTVQAIEEWLEGHNIERKRVRDGSKPLPPKTYWDPDLGHYVAPYDDEWSEQRYKSLLKKPKNALRY